MKDFATEIARAAGQILRDNYEQVLEVERKSRLELVTNVDRESERLIVQAIGDRYPDHAIIAEEEHAAAEGAEFVWYVDPLDGTNNYAHGFPVFSVSIGLRRGEDLILGVVYEPLRDELFSAETGEGATLNGRPIHVSETVRLEESLVATGFPYARGELQQNNLAEFNRVTLSVRGIRRAGSAAVDMAYLAAGRLDGYWEYHLRPWDWAAGTIIVQEAGGTVTDCAGKPWTLSKNDVLASNGLIHGELQEVLRGT